MPRIPTLVTERLVLRPPSPGDLADFVALGADPEVMRYIGVGATQTAAQAGFWLECMLADARHGFPTPGAPEGLPGWLVAIERETQAFVGLAVLTMLSPAHAQAIGPELGSPPHVEVGYRLAPPYWGKGYATEAGRALVDYGFDVTELDRIVAIADVRNAASNRVLEKLGLRTQTTYELNGVSIHFRSIFRSERR